MKQSLVSYIKNLLLNILKRFDPLGYVAAAHLEKEIKAEYSNALFVNVKGLINSCGVCNHNQKADADWIDFEVTQQHNGLLSIHINTNSLLRFIEDYLPKVKKSFVLVVGNSDLSFNSDLLSFSQVQILLDNPLLKAVFAQNIDMEHPKVFPLPIGLDYHNVWEKPRQNSLGYRLTPLLHERLLLKTAAESVKPVERRNLMYCNWHFKLDRGNRSACFDRVNHQLCFFEETPLDRLQNYSKQSEFKFVLSPSGLGIDCYRTWEAIILGCIPILKRSKWANQFTHLPVIIVDTWEELTSEMLDEHFNDLVKKEFDYSFIFMDYWKMAIKMGYLPTEKNIYQMTPDAYHQKIRSFHSLFLKSLL
jgi:hypothetical protein